MDVKKKRNIDKSIEKFSYSKIKELPDKEQINIITKFFLDNNKINYINSNEHIDRYEGTFFAIRGNRNMALQVDESTLDKNIMKIIIMKYIKDRITFLNSININNIYLEKSNKTCFEVKTDYLFNDNNYVMLNLKTTKNNELIQFEKDFLINFIKNKLKDLNEIVKVSYVSDFNEDYSKEWNGYNIKCNSFSIKLKENLFMLIENIITEHNKLINEKKLQLKL